MTSEPNRFTAEEWESRIEGIDLEIARMAIICKVPLLEPGVAERELHNDAQVCGSSHPTAFTTLRGLLYLHFTESRDLKHSLGPEQAREVADAIRAQLRKRSGRAPDETAS